MKLHDQFEDRINREIWANGDYSVRIPQGAKVIGRGKLVKIKTPFDFACSIRGRAVFFDAKSTAENRFNLASKVTSEKSMHQFNQLREAARAGAIAGYLIWFYQLRLITWVPIDVMAERNLVSIAPYHRGTTTAEDNRRIDLARMVLPSLTGLGGAQRSRPAPGIL